MELLLPVLATATLVNYPANFSANMGSGMVLQRAPLQASLYGYVGDLSVGALPSPPQPAIPL